MCAMSSAVTEARRPVAPGHGATAAPSCCEGRIFGPLGTSGHWNNQIFASSTFQFQNSQRGECVILFDTHKKINETTIEKVITIGGIERRSAKIFPHLTAYDL